MKISLLSHSVASVALALSLGALAGLNGGCKKSTTNNDNKSAPGKPKVALVMKSLANEFFSTMAEGAKQHQAANAATYDLVVNGIKNETDLAEQVNLVEQMIAQQVNAIVIAPADSKAMVTVIKHAKEAGILVVNIDNKLDADVLRQADIKVPFVGPDNRAGARKVGEALAKQLQAGDKVAIIGPNGIGKTTLLRCLVGDLAADYGVIKWTDKAKVGYYAQDSTSEFAQERIMTDWMTYWRGPNDDDQTVRATLGRLLFSGDDAHKPVSVLSGGEKGRLLFGKLMLQRNNVLLMDEPTNHMDMESIESLNTALLEYKGTVVFVSHDREFVSSVATRIIEISAKGVTDYHGTYEEYLRDQGMTN